MKTSTLLTCCALAVGLAYQANAQGGGGGFGGGGGGGGFGGGGGGFGGGGRGGFLTQEQNQSLTDALANDATLTDLQTKLAAAQKDAVNAALDSKATADSVKAKIQAVSDIQTQIAMERYTKGVKSVVASVTADQKTQLDTAPAGYAGAYNTLFGGGRAGGRGGGFGGGGAGGGFGGGGRGARGGGGAGN
jgi:hypothetical protein